tara:strand:+ start:158 stop:889 length:732 start_codon:yes stop_codon:yes gene_type:complete
MGLRQGTRGASSSAGGASSAQWSWRSLRPASMNGAVSSAVAFDASGTYLAAAYTETSTAAAPSSMSPSAARRARAATARTFVEVWEMGSVYSVVRVLRLAEHRLELTSTEAATPLGTPERAGCDKPVVALTWSPCSRFLIVAHENGRVVVWDVVAAVPLCDAYALVEDGAGAVDLTVLRAWRERVACEAQPAELTGADLDAGAEAARHVRCRAFASPAAGMRSHAHSSSSCGSVVSAVGSAGV